MVKTSKIFLYAALALSISAFILLFPYLKFEQQALSLTLLAVFLSIIVVITQTRVSDSLREEINRIKGLKGEMAERGKKNVLSRLLGPIVIYLVFLGILRLLVGGGPFPEVLSAVLLYLVAVGKEMVAPIAAGVVEAHGSVTLPLIILALAFDDIICGLWMVLNWDVIKFVPFLGKYLDKIESTSKQTVEEKSWLGKFSTVGLALLVTFPMRGSGGITGPIIGKMLGLRNRNIFVAVVAGGIAGFAILVPAFYFAMEPIQRFFGVTSTWGITAIMLVMVIAVIITYRFIQSRRNND